MQTTISNEFLTVTIDTHGAEVVSVKNSKGEELIWQADPTIWDRHSPVLFPWAGRLANGELIHNGKHYSGGQHGFIRDLEHILKQNNGISAQLMFRADEETKTLRFPFDFEFTSVFTLDGHTLHHEVHVKNCGDENMRCGIGFHPGFNIPFDENHTTTDYEIRFEQEESPIILDCLPHGLLSGKSFYQWKNSRHGRWQVQTLASRLLACPLQASTRQAHFQRAGRILLQIFWHIRPFHRAVSSHDTWPPHQ